MTLVWRPGYGGAAVSDPDAQAYLQAVEVADNQALEQGVQQAVNQFVIGCKTDGIWSAIKASCILAGARTLTGALIPLAGTAPTNNNFVSGDYDRKTGLIGNGTTKYLNSNRNNNADPQNSNHQGVYISNAGTVASMFLIGAGVVDSGSTSLAKLTPSGLVVRNRSGSDGGTFGSALTTGFYGASRSTSTIQVVRTAQSSSSQSVTSQTPFNGNVFVFGSNTGTTLSLPTDSRLAFYSIGESLDLAKLDTRVTALITAIGAAIP